MVENPSQCIPNPPPINALAMAYVSASQRFRWIDQSHEGGKLEQEIEHLRLGQGMLGKTHPGLGAIGCYLNSDIEGGDEHRVKRQRKPP